MKAFVIAANNLRRMFRQISNIFFIFIFPMLLILLLGASFGGTFTPRLGIISADTGPLSDGLISALESSEGLDVELLDDPESLRSMVERGSLEGGVIIPGSYSHDLRSGGEARVEYLLRPDQTGQQIRTEVESAVAGQAVILRAARFAAAESDVAFDVALGQAASVSQEVPPIFVDLQTAGQATYPEDLGRFDLGASSQLMLFIFLTSLTGSVALIETRHLGLSRRMLSTPTAARTIITGEMMGRLGIALVQGLFIMAGSLLLFGVSWGDPAGALALLFLFALVGAGAGMLVGSLFNTEQQAISLGLLLGLGLAALGGCMVPLEIFSGTMRKVAHITPHAWALDGYSEIVRHDEGIGGILPEMAVLAGYAAVLLSLATWRLRRAITA